MKLHQIEPGKHNLFTGYGPGYVSVNNVRHEIEQLQKEMLEQF